MTGVPFQVPIFGAGSAVIVEAAFGANLAAAPGTWTWFDITADVMYNPGIDGTWGRGDETSQTQPSTMNFSLLNTSGNYGEFTATGIYGENVRKGTPVRVSRKLGAGATIVEWLGVLIGATPTFDTTGKLPIVQFECAGYLRILGQPQPPVYSPMYNTISGSSPIAYWPMEDGAGATQAASGLRAGTPLKLVAGSGAVTFGSDASAGSAASIDFSPGGTLYAPIPSTSAPWRLSFMFNSTDYQMKPMVNVQTSDGAIWTLSIGAAVAPGNSVNTNYSLGGISQQGTASGGAYLLNDGKWHYYEILLSQNGSTVRSTVYVDGRLYQNVGDVVGAAVTLMPAVAVYVAPNVSILPSHSFKMAQLALWANTNVLLDLSDALAGYAGELPHVRMARLAAETGVSLAITGTSNIAMGPQLNDTLLANLRACEKTDGGVLYDGFSYGISYQCRSTRYNAAAALTIDAGANSQLAPPFAPISDDQRIVNQFTASRDSGSSYTFADVVSKLSTTAIGIFPGSDSFSLADDSNLPGIAGWRVNLGTVYGLRYPTLTVNFINSNAAALAPSWMSAISGTQIGFRVDVTNVTTSAPTHPPGTVSLIVEGYAVHSDLHSWSVVANCSAFSPNRVFAINGARVDAAATVVYTGGINTTSTSLSIDWTTGPGPWVNSTDFPADFPFQIECETEVMTVTAASKVTVVPQVFTVTRSVNGVVKAHAAGARVRIYQPAKVAL